ncbi:MAG: hypothetical protein ACPHQD_04680 [Vibrio toranzoniae]|uniref:hypothetical protein n=1 Tax=Vibrio toranzoniae TaxID=1194427 RepID=UPI003C5FFAE1
MTEHDFIRSIHKKLPSSIYRWKIHDTFTGGVPDAFYMGPAGVVFVEYKYTKKLPAKPSTNLPVKVSNNQIAWLNRALNSPLKPALIIGHRNKAIIIENNFTQSITKEYYVNGCLPIESIIDWIVQNTLGEYTNGPNKGCSKPSAHLGC